MGRTLGWAVGGDYTVYDALGDAMTTEIHALELTTYTPEEADERES